jgi:putative membrane protein
LQRLTGHLAQQIRAIRLHSVEPIQFPERPSLQPTPVRKVADFFGPAHRYDQSQERSQELASAERCARQPEGNDMILQSLAGLPGFLAYFCTAFVVTIGYLFVYTRITPHDEFELIRQNVPGAAIALGLSLLGFALPLASVIAHTENLLDCVIWSIIALIVQVVIYFAVRIPIPNLAQRIAAGDIAPAIWLGLASLAAGALSAASISY